MQNLKMSFPTTPPLSFPPRNEVRGKLRRESAVYTPARCVLAQCKVLNSDKTTHSYLPAGAEQEQVVSP